MSNEPSSEFTRDALSSGHAPFPAEDKNQRESDRVFLCLHIRVAGIAENAKDLWEEGRTVDVSRRGAAIMVDLELHTGQNIKIQRVGSGKEAMAKVVGRLAGWS
jgi:hypothetical protein